MTDRRQSGARTKNDVSSFNISTRDVEHPSHAGDRGPATRFALTDEQASAVVGFISACEDWGLTDPNLLGAADALAEQMADLRLVDGGSAEVEL